jgi:tRNA-Thr(GGU) m(6)t(6)A37 methyltransferase TsaA
VDSITIRPIGVIHTAFEHLEGMPIQAAAAAGAPGWIDIDPELAEGLRDLDGFSHLIVLSWCHLAGPTKLSVVPFLDDRTHGVFATRSPARPNPIALSTVRLVAVTGNRLDIRDVDMLDGTPCLDIKPYVPELDDRADARIGWYTDRIGGLPSARADDRFGEAGRGTERGGAEPTTS